MDVQRRASQCRAKKSNYQKGEREKKKLDLVSDWLVSCRALKWILSSFMSCIHVCVGGVIYFIAEVRTKLKEERTPCRAVGGTAARWCRGKRGFYPLAHFVAAGAVDDIKRRWTFTAPWNKSASGGCRPIKTKWNRSKRRSGASSRKRPCLKRWRRQAGRQPTLSAKSLDCTSACGVQPSATTRLHSIIKQQQPPQTKNKNTAALQHTRHNLVVCVYITRLMSVTDI